MIDFSLSLDFSDHEALRIGILSDTHGSLNPEIAAFIRQCDIALHAGDIMGAAPLQALQPRLGHTYAVKGNNDAHISWDEKDHALLDEIPDLLELMLPGGKLVMEHSHRFWDPDFDKIHHALREAHADAQLVVYGHTHIRTINDSHEPAVINPGAAGAVRVHDGPSCMELNVSADRWEVREHLFSAG